MLCKPCYTVCPIIVQLTVSGTGHRLSAAAKLATRIDGPLVPSSVVCPVMWEEYGVKRY